MNIKISEMPQATSVSGSDVIPIVQSGVSKKADIDTILKAETSTGTGITAMDTDQSTFFKSGKICVVTLNFHITSAVNTNGDLYTSIPYLPKNNQRGMIINTSGSTWCVNIRTDGTIKIMDRQIGSGWYNGYGVYILE